MALFRFTTSYLVDKGVCMHDSLERKFEISYQITFTVHVETMWPTYNFLLLLSNDPFQNIFFYSS